MRTIRVQWNSGTVDLTWYRGVHYPPIGKVTSVHGVCFLDEKVLLVNIKGRGFNLPGGHVEAGEKVKEAFNREVWEEGYVKGESSFIGYIEVSHKHNPLFNPHGKYPLVGYQLFYRMDISKKYDFKREHESSCRIWVEPEELPFVIQDHKLVKEIIQAALDEKSIPRPNNLAQIKGHR
ncbi:NUDIX hydrolase [Rossellomorea sp. BNER]|uniref:NUDIX hydrolase n=1 Tax=Rossellomorea sp. BNER TaxID=2962031 RepID=UPI003AF260D8|nr:NUDIX domain-containing protein [Rossellomorea sp. BNER]